MSWSRNWLQCRAVLCRVWPDARFCRAVSPPFQPIHDSRRDAAQPDHEHRSRDGNRRCDRDQRRARRVPSDAGGGRRRAHRHRSGLGTPERHLRAQLHQALPRRGDLRLPASRGRRTRERRGALRATLPSRPPVHSWRSCPAPEADPAISRSKELSRLMWSKLDRCCRERPTSALRLQCLSGSATWRRPNGCAHAIARCQSVHCLLVTTPVSATNSLRPKGHQSFPVHSRWPLPRSRFS